MKYIRTEEHKLIYETKNLIKVEDARFPNGYLTKDGVPLIATKQADTIEKLCDEFVMIDEENEHYIKQDNDIHHIRRKWAIGNWAIGNYKVYGAIWTDKGLIYVAKLNEKGELELI